jgi:hypothetical protein
MPSGGRGFDQNGDGPIGSSEGTDATAPHSLVGARDTLRQSVVDLMQLTRLIETGGIDVNGDGACELDGNRIYYFGISYAGMYGPMLLAVEPSIRTGVSSVGGGALGDAARLGLFRTHPGCCSQGTQPAEPQLGRPATRVQREHAVAR